MYLVQDVQVVLFPWDHSILENTRDLAAVCLKSPSGKRRRSTVFKKGKKKKRKKEKKEKKTETLEGALYNWPNSTQVLTVAGSGKSPKARSDATRERLICRQGWRP
jgi:hypothetical protein